MTLVTKATRGSVAPNSWGTPGNAVSDNGVYATAAPGKNATIVGDWDFAAFSDVELPVGATINSVTIRAQYKVSVNSSVAHLHVEAGNNGAFDAIEEEQTEPLADADFDVVYNTTPSETDLKTAGRLVARIGAHRGNSNNGVTFSLDYVELRVDYTTSSIVEADGAAAGAATVLSVAAAIATAATAAVGLAASAVVGAALWLTVAASPGVATVDAASATVLEGVGASTGLAADSVVGASMLPGVASSAGVGTASADGADAASTGSDASAAGSATVLGVGAAPVAATGSAAATSTAEAYYVTVAAPEVYTGDRIILDRPRQSPPRQRVPPPVPALVTGEFTVTLPRPTVAFAGEVGPVPGGVLLAALPRPVFEGVAHIGDGDDAVRELLQLVEMAMTAAGDAWLDD